jgi:hypothetical protein
VTANELLVLLGRAWSRLLIYPGGLTAFGLVWLLSTLQNREPRTANREPRTASQIVKRLDGSRCLALSSILLPWLALALLPLPLAVALPRQIDIVVALALLEWPNLLAISQDLRAGNMRRLAAALNSYPPLILATLALAQAGNSLELAALVRAPGSPATTSTSALHWLGVIALALALPAALGIGPFADGRPPTADRRPPTADRRPPTADRRPPTADRRPPTADVEAFSQSPIPNPQIGLRLRALGLIALAALPWAGTDSTGIALLRMLGAAALIAALLWGFDRLTRGQAARRWAWAYLGLDVVLLLALLGAAYLALQIRLA